MLNLKHKKETDKEFAHTEVYKNNKLVGYFIKNKSSLSVKNENWNFCSKSELPFFHAKTKKEMIGKLEKMAETF